MPAQNAETLALKGLVLVAGDQEALDRFIALSGLDEADLRQRAGDPELLAAVLDFVLGDDALIGRLCEAENISPAALHAARRALPGGMHV